MRDETKNATDSTIRWDAAYRQWNIKNIKATLSFHPQALHQVHEITLDATSKSNLSWDDAINEAKNTSGFILWKFVFDEIDVSAVEYENVQFAAVKKVMHHFRLNLLPLFQDQTLGFCVGQIDVSKLISNTKHSYLAWCSYVQGLKYLDENTKKLMSEITCDQYCSTSDDFITRSKLDSYLESLSVYFHHLGSLCDENYPVFLKVTHASSLSIIDQTLLLNSERFEHLNLYGLDLHSNLGKLSYENEQSNQLIEAGICLPSSDWALFSQGCVFQDQFNNLLNGQRLRLIPDDRIMQEWDQLELLYVFKKYLTIFTKRQLQGFEAAGGQVIYIE